MAETLMTTTLEQHTDASLEALHAKLDRLVEQVDFLSREMEELRQQRELWTDLGRDLAPVMESLYLMAVEQLEELSPYVQLEDLWRLLLRFLRSARLLDQLLQELETLHDLLHDLGPVVHDASLLAINKLDELEKKGYFALLKELAQTLDALVTHIRPEDLQRLRAALLSALEQARQAQEQPPSTWRLLQMMRDPDVRRGLALGLYLLKALGNGSAQAAAAPKNGS